MGKIFFWEKSASTDLDAEKDQLRAFDIVDDPSIRELVRNLEEKHIGDRTPLTEMKPKLPSILRWIREIMNSRPPVQPDLIENLLDAFRAELSARSKEKEKGVGILLLNDYLILAHFSTERSLAKYENKAYSVELILNQKNIYRGVIVKKEGGHFLLSAYEQSRKFTKSFAEFLGIDPDKISWEATGTLGLVVEFTSFPFPANVQIETEDLDKMVAERTLTPQGTLRMGKEKGTVTKVQIGGKTLSFEDFHDFYVTHKEKIDSYRNKLSVIVPSNPLFESLPVESVTCRYEEDSDAIKEILPTGQRIVMRKDHPRYVILCTTPIEPGVKPSTKLMHRIHNAILGNNPLEVCHVKERATSEYQKFGNLKIFNEKPISEDQERLLENLLNIAQDANGRKGAAILGLTYLVVLQKLSRWKHFNYLLQCIAENIAIPELESEFVGEGIADKEDFVEFKSAGDVDPKPTRFVNSTLVPTVQKYVQDGFSRFVILYGVEDSGEIKPLYNLKSDQLAAMETLANKELASKGASVKLFSIPFKEGKVLMTCILPDK